MSPAALPKPRFVLALLLAAAPAAAQVPNAWYAINTGHGGNGYDEAKAVAVDTQGNVYVTGTIGNVPSGPSCCNGDLIVVKYDKNGVQQWGMGYDGSAHGNDVGNSIALDHAGNVYVAGAATGTGTGLDIVVAKFDPAGNAKWLKLYNGPGNGDDYLDTHSLVVDRFGHVTVAGLSAGTGTGFDFVTIQYDADTGNRNWVARYNGPGGTNDKGRAIAEDVYGNVYVTGYSNSGGDYTARFATVKYDPKGQQQWVARTPATGSGLDYPFEVALDRAGNVFVTGITYPGVPLGQPPPQLCATDLLTAKYSPSGQPLWSKTYDGPGHCDDLLPVIAVDTTGNAYVAATSEGSGHTPGSNPPIDIGQDFVTIKYAGSNGAELWTRRYTSKGNVTNPNDSVGDIALDLYGDLYVAGTSAKEGDDYDVVTLKYGSDGSQLFESRFERVSRDAADAIAVDRNRNFYVAGWTYSGATTDLDMLTVKNTIQSKEPGPAFDWSPEVPTEGQTIQFQDQSSNSPTAWEWDFNRDGITDSTLQNPTRIFVHPGTYDVTLKASNAFGSASITEQVVVESQTKAPYVENVVRDYEGFFLEGVDLKNKFRANINWKGAPGTAAFSVNSGAAAVEPGDVGGATHQYDMKTDFAPQLFSPNVLAITPTNGDSPPLTGLPREESVWVFPYPDWLKVTLTPIKVKIEEGAVKWEIEKEFPDPHFQTLFVFPQSVPYVGGDFGVSETFAKLGGFVSSTGVGGLSAEGQTGFKALGGSIDGKLSGSGEFRLFPPDGLILQKASLGFSLVGTIKKTEGFLDAIPQLAALQAVPVVGSAIGWLNDHATLTGEISPSLKFTAAFEQMGGALEFKEGTGTLGLDLKATLEIKILEGLSAKGWVGGGGSFTAGVPVTADKPLLRGGEIHFEAGCEFTANYLFNYTATAKYDAKCTWTPVAGVACDSSGSSASALAPGGESLENAGVALRHPDYDRFGKYSDFRKTARMRPASAKSALGTADTTLVSNVFPGASPQILAAGGGRLLLWVSQDPGRPVLQSTGISWSFDGGSGWSTPALVVDDSQVELSPAAGVDGNGKVVAAWLRIKDASFSASITTAADLPLFFTRLEVVSAVFDPTTKTWGSVTALTNDTAYDSDLHLSADGSGNLMLTWLSNAAGEFQSSVAKPSVLKYALWNGASWSAPAAIASNLAGVHAHAAARRGTAAFVVLSRDPDPAVSNDGVLDLYTWNGTSWNGATTFASGGVENRLPSAVYDGSGTGHVVWVRGTDLVHATLASPTPEVVRGGSDSLAFYETRLLVNGDGNLTILRTDSGNDGPGNVFATTYDPVSDTWSRDVPITRDAWQARDLSAYFGAGGAIHAAYLATDIVRTTKTVTIGGQSVDIPNIPDDGQTDLRLLDHTLGTDLAVSDEDLVVSPARPAAGDAVTATLTVHNAGDLATGSFAVKLYVGDPSAGGALVGTQTVTGPFVAGDSTTVSFSFTEPSTTGDLVAVADADGDIAESSETNNTAVIPLGSNHPPEARILASASSGPAPLSVTLDASSSFDPDGDGLAFAWVFGDGTPSGEGASLSHTFTAAGSYPVTLAVTDAHGAVGTTVAVITVGAGPAVFGISPTSGPAAGNTAVGISGDGFLSGATVKIGGIAATSVAVVNATTITAKTPSLAAGTLADVVVTNPGSGPGTLAKGWFADFADVPQAYLYHGAIEKIVRAGITTGCGGGNYCPNDPVNRSAMAVFILRGEHGSAFNPPAASGTVFSDVSTTTFLAKWIEAFAAEGITTGCGGGKYCPTDSVTRDAMAVFLLRGRNGSPFTPTAATGTVFGDVHTTTFLAKWMEELKAEGITSGCSGGNYCPGGTVTRGEMAKFIRLTFGLP
ncbi:MAG: PKD domain-containing protein [Acidobacteriota bacterium]